MVELSTLERVDLRDVWKTEDQHFTPWLAQQKNLTELGKAIGLDLEIEAQDKECRALQSRHSVPRYR